MRLYIGEDRVDLTDIDLDYMYIDEGSEACVYKYGCEALKIYKPEDNKNRLSESSASTLSEYSSLMKRILLPKRLVYDDGYNFCGYTTDFIYKASTENLPKMKMEKFLDEINLIRDDVTLLGKDGILVDDLWIDNTIYNGNIYLIDPGSYFIDRKCRSNLVCDNLGMLNELVVDDFFGMIKMTAKQKTYLSEIMSDYSYVGDFILETANNNENMRQYVKRMIR